MLKNLWITVVAALVSTMPIHATAADMKIGFVNVAKLLDLAPQSEDASRRLRGEFEPLEKELFAAQEKLKAKEERLARDGEIMSAGERQNLEREIRDGLRDLKRLDREFKEDFADRQREEMNVVQRTFMEAIQKMAEDENYDLILTEGVAYVAPDNDVTDRLLERLGK